MVPIIFTADNKPFAEEDFFTLLFNLCNEDKQAKRALAFAFIVYDIEDYTIQQVLKDENYWTTLDKISGHFLSIFYINSKNDYYKKRQQQIYQQELRQQRRNSQDGMMQLFRPITLRDTPLDKSIDFLKEEFGLEENLKHPFVLFFQTDGEKLTDYFVVVLKQEKLEEAFLELRTQINNAVSSLSNVKPEYFKNHQEIFDLLKSGVKSGNFLQFIDTKIISKIGISQIVKFIRLLGGS